MVGERPALKSAQIQLHGAIVSGCITFQKIFCASHFNKNSVGFCTVYHVLRGRPLSNLFVYGSQTYPLLHFPKNEDRKIGR